MSEEEKWLNAAQNLGNLQLVWVLRNEIAKHFPSNHRDGWVAYPTDESIPLDQFEFSIGNVKATISKEELYTFSEELIQRFVAIMLPLLATKNTEAFPTIKHVPERLDPSVN